MFLHFEKYEDFVSPVMPGMHELGEIIDPPLYTERYMRALSPEALREHAEKLYTMFGQQIIGAPVPLQDAKLIEWILMAQGKISAIAKEPHKAGMVYFQGAMLTIKDDRALRMMSVAELRQYAMMLYSTISGKVRDIVETVPSADGALIQYVLSMQAKYLRAEPCKVK